MGEVLTQLPPEYNDPTKYRLNAAGSVVSVETGRIVANPGGGKYAIAPATSRELRSLWREKKLRDKLRGMVRGAGVEPSEIDEELIRQAGSAAEVYYAHLGSTFLSSKNLRGMGETIERLLSVGEEGDKEAASVLQSSAVADLAAAIRSLAEKQERDIIDGTVTDAE